MLKGLLFIIGLCSICLCILFFVGKKYGVREHGLVYHHNFSDVACCLDIAHAGGAYKGHYYTNSLEALNSHYDNGRRIFEIDFVVNKDGDALLTHDKSDETLKTAAFMSWNGAYTRLDLKALNVWLESHEDAIIVTDTKNSFAFFYANLLSQASASFIEKHYVFQVYSLAQLEGMQKQYKGASLILTLYRMSGDHKKIMKEIKKLDTDIAITMPLSYARAHLAKLRAENPRKRFYVHGRPAEINLENVQFKLRKLGASGFYLD